MKSFDIKTKIYFGDNALDRLADLPYKKALIITDPFVVKSGMLQMITYRLNDGYTEFDVFSDVVPDPPIEKISLGVKAMLDYDPDVVIAIGGGSAIDSAKSIREFATRASQKEVALIAIPTTSGTGSEVKRTSFAVVSDPANDIKYPLVSDSMLPTEAILDADLVKSVPANVTADTGMDVLTHAIEAYVSIQQQRIFSRTCRKVNRDMRYSSYFVHILTITIHTQERKCTLRHVLQVLHLTVHHLVLTTVLLTQSVLSSTFRTAEPMQCYFLTLSNTTQELTNKYSRSQSHYPKCVEKYVNVAKLLGVNNFNEITTVRALVSSIEFMLKEMNVPVSVSQCGVDRTEYFNAIDSMAEKALADACTATNPRVPTKEEVVQILEHLYE